MISFTMRCRFSIDPGLRKIESDELVVYDTELSEFVQRKTNRIRATSKQSPLTDEQILTIYERLKEVNISDAVQRQQHIDKIKSRTSR